MTPRRFAFLICALLACGKDSGPQTNLKPVFFRTIANAPVATFTLNRQNGAAMDKARVTLDSRPTFDGWLKVGRATTAQASTSGVASVAMPAGTYPVTLSPNVAGVGSYLDSLAISGDVSRTYQTSQQNWTVTSPKAFAAIEIDVYQVDSDGRALIGTQAAPLQPLILVSQPAVPGGNATSMTFATELFKGSYRAVIFATPVASTDSIAPFETAAFNAAGGGVTETQNVTLSAGGNVISLKLVDAGGAAVPDSQIGELTAYDADTYLNLGSAETSGGVGTVQTGSVSHVMGIVSAQDGGDMSVASYTASPTHSATLTRYTVNGHAKLPSGAALAQPFGSVSATLTSTPGFPWNSVSPVSADISDALGTYQIHLVGGSWSLQATRLTNLPRSNPVAVNVSGDIASQDIALDPGGVISGNIQDQAHNNLQNVTVDVYDGSHTRVGAASTDASGNYSIAVPGGTYELLANGALTQGVSVATGATKTQNLTRYQITGRLTDAQAAAVAGKVTWGGGSATASTLGTYTLDVIEGINWFLFSPPTTSPSLGFVYETNVLVNADTVKTLQ